MTMYESPLGSRYAGKTMQCIFSKENRIKKWHLLWLNLAKAQKELGLSIPDNAITTLEKNLYHIPFDKAKVYEEKFRHDVMAHLHALGDICPEAKGILHLGATSCYVTDNGDLMQYQEALHHLLGKLYTLTEKLSVFAKKYHHLICLAYTHYQAAQPTTVGKRACLWLQDFYMDAKALLAFCQNMQYLGLKGATGTQSSFMALFGGNREKVLHLERTLQKLMGWDHIFPISGQTYARKQDAYLLHLLSQFAISCTKMATDLRLLAHDGEITEGFTETQVGSSAMHHKKNPIMAERICSLARFVICLEQNGVQTACNQWLERTLDDSANRRLAIPEAFLGCDAICNLAIHLIDSLQVHEEIIDNHLESKIPYLMMETLLMKAAEKGKSRQEVHEILRKECLHTEKICLDHWMKKLSSIQELGLSLEEIEEAVGSTAIAGLASEQTLAFLEHEIKPMLAKHSTEKVQGDPIYF